MRHLLRHPFASAWSIPSLLMALVLVCASGATASAQTTNLYYLVIDRSGSISNHNLVAPICGALMKYLGYVSDGSEVDIVFFSSKADSPRKWEAVNYRLLPEILDYVRSGLAEPEGMTRLYDTTAEVLERVLPRAKAFQEIRVVILTDGEDERKKGEARRFGSWQPVEVLAQAVLDANPQSFIQLVTVNHNPKDRPRPGGPIHHRLEPNPGSGFEIHVDPAPKAAFRVSPSPATVGKDVLFSLLHPMGVRKVTWSFGDSETSTDFSPLHSYKQAGRLPVRVEVQGRSAKLADTAQAELVVENERPLKAAFHWLPIEVHVGDTIHLIDDSEGGPTSREWRLSKGTVSGGPDTSFEAVEEGSVKAFLAVRRDALESRAERTIPIGPRLPKQEDAEFDISPPSLRVKVGDMVTFRARRTVSDTKHLYRCGPREIRTAEAQWKAEGEGPVEIHHDVETPGGPAHTTKVIFVERRGISARFETAPSAGSAKLLRVRWLLDPVTFRNCSDGPVARCRYDFGDGESTDIWNPTHQYRRWVAWHTRLVPRLTVWDAEGRSFQSAGDITVEVRVWWHWVAITAGVIVVAAWSLWARKNARQPLYGSLEWSYVGTNDSAEIQGKSFHLSGLGIEGWSPEARPRIEKKGGRFLLVRDGEKKPTTITPGETFSVNGASLTLRTSTTPTEPSET